MMPIVAIPAAEADWMRAVDVEQQRLFRAWHPMISVRRRAYPP